MLIDNDLIKLDADIHDKKQAIETIAQLLEEKGKLNNKEQYIRDVFQRETEMSTNLGGGVGLPHARSFAVNEAGLVFIRCQKPIQWPSDISDEDVKMIFGIAVPESGGNQHLRIIAQLARHLIYEEFKDKLLNAVTSEQLLELLQDATKGV